MSWFAARTAIKDKFVTAWAARTPITFDNDSFDPTTSVDANGNPEPWVYFEIMENGSEIAGFGQLGANTIRYHGLIFAHVFAPLNTGADAALQLAEVVSDLFRTVSFSGIQTWVPSPPSPVHRNEQFGTIAGSGNWWRCYTHIPFSYTFSG